MTLRIICCVPHCPRTTSKPCGEWICREHWRAVGRRTRMLWRGYERRCKAGGEEIDRVRAEFWWGRCKAEAIEAAGGIR